MRYLLLLALLSAGCIERAGNKLIDDRWPEIRDDIENKIWRECTEFYEEQVIPVVEASLALCTAQVNELTDEIHDLRDYVEVLSAGLVFESVGCIEDAAHETGWDCSEVWCQAVP